MIKRLFNDPNLAPRVWGMDRNYEGSARRRGGNGEVERMLPFLTLPLVSEGLHAKCLILEERGR